MEPHSGALLAILVFLALFAAVYFIPTIIAFSRHHRNRWAIFVINIFGGVTILLWIVALVWAVSSQGPAQIQVVGAAVLLLAVQATVTLHRPDYR